MTAGRSKKQCAFCEQKIAHIDYKNVRMIRHFVSQYGRIVPRYYSGVCLQHQKKLSRSIKHAREMALVGYGM